MLTNIPLDVAETELPELEQTLADLGTSSFPRATSLSMDLSPRCY